VYRNKTIIHSFVKSLCFYNSKRIIANLLEASSHNTYVETISSCADTLHKNLEDWNNVALQQNYSRICENNMRKLHLGLCEVMIDITEEDFYGKTQGFWIIPWTGEEGIQGHFKFLVCSVKYRNRKYPIAARMIRLGAIICEEIGAVLASCNNAGLRINTVLLDRGFQSLEIIDELQKREVNYILFTRKTAAFSSMLAGMEKSAIIEYETEIRKNKTTLSVKRNIALVKNVLGYDWIFTTNLNISGAEIVRKYRVRWNIETDFRVQDEARIKSKSTRPEVRLFYFMIALLLFFVWSSTQKFEVSFKKFIIILSRTETIDNNLFFE
jgi:hypothetical protein